MIGETFGGKYSVARLLGQGGMGAVYEARHVTTGRRVALKVMTEEVAKHAAQLQRFEREARAAGQLESQYIAQVLDAGKDEATGVPFLVMELLTGSDLDQLEHRVGILPQDLAVRIVAQACMGLSKAHAAGIVHRDIKPGNMFLAEREEGDVVVKLLDFGVAKVSVAEEDATSLTQTGSLIGTPLYMSPEQAAGEKIIDARADVWAIGVVLYQALAGRTPHHDVTTIGKLILRICSSPAPALQSLAPWVNPSLAEVVHRALEIEPGARFQSIDAMLAALRTLAPNGVTVNDTMLTGISAEERASHADGAPARVESVPPAPVPGAATSGVDRTQIAAEGSIDRIVSAESPSKDLVRTTSASSTDRIASSRPPAKSNTSMIAVAAVATFGLAGGAYFFGSRGHTDASPAETQAAAPVQHDAPTTAATNKPAGIEAPAPAQPDITPASAVPSLAAAPSASSKSALPTAVPSGALTKTPLPLPLGPSKKPPKVDDPTKSM